MSMIELSLELIVVMVEISLYYSQSGKWVHLWDFSLFLGMRAEQVIGHYLELFGLSYNKSYIIGYWYRKHILNIGSCEYRCDNGKLV